MRPAAALVPPSNDINIIERFNSADPAVRECILGMWINLLLTVHADLVRKIQEKLGTSAQATMALQCQAELIAHPEYDYIVKYGTPQHKEQVAALLASLGTVPQQVKIVEPATLAPFSVVELRMRVARALDKAA